MVQPRDRERLLPATSGAWRSHWSELAQLVESARTGTLALREATRLAELYRLLASDLLRSRRAGVDDVGRARCEELMRRAYAIVYAPPRERRAALAWRFVKVGFPQLVRREATLIALAASLVLLGALCGAAVMHYDPAAIGVVVPDMHQDLTPKERIRDDATHALFDPGGSAAFSSFLFTHNIQVTFMVFALGLTAGLGSAAVLFWNGIPLGALAVQYIESGEAWFFAAWILPHGVIELSVVAIAGGAGFVLARGLLRPGNRDRRSALYAEARQALLLVLGGMPLLVVAGLVEGSLSQLHPPQMPVSAKLAIATLLALGLTVYLGWSGRTSAAAGDRADD